MAMETMTMENSAEEQKPVTGLCQYCGQLRSITETEDEWLQLIRETGLSGQELADYIAARECNCLEGQKFRDRDSTLRNTQMLIEGMFRDKHPEVADCFQQQKAAVYDREIKKIIIQKYGEGKAVMQMDRDEIKLQYFYTNKTEATSG